MLTGPAALLPLFAASAIAVAPGEVGPVWLAPDGTLSWPVRADATRYNVYAGSLPALADHLCRLEGLATTRATLPETPAPGALVYYLVSAVNRDGEGVLGLDRGMPVANPFPCNNDSDRDGVRDSLDNCPTVPNRDQADQNEDEIGDRCDPKTYDFEADAVGARPAATTPVGGANPSFAVRDLGGDLGAAYDSPGSGSYDRFDRLEAGRPFADTTVWLDYELVNETCSLELWSDGSYSWNAGTGLILQLTALNDLRLYERWGASVPVVVGPMLPSSGRLRVRLEKGFASESWLHVDAWDGSQWQLDHGAWAIADDHRYRGLSTALGDYLGARRAVRRITVEHARPAAALVLRKHPSWSADWKLYQRDAAGQAAIPLRFHYRLAEAGRVRARVLWSATRVPLPGHDWTDHELALAAGDGADAELLVAGVPTGGNYDVELELVADADPGRALGSGFVANLAVGDVWLAAGQSNMAGYSGGLGGAETPIDEVHLFHNDYTWQRASEPMDDGTDQLDRVSAESPGHSLLLRFAKELVRATGVPIAIIPGPLGGTNLYAQWQRDAGEHAHRGTLYGSLLHRARLQAYATAPVGLLWFQGESDALARRTTAEYRADLERLVAWYRDDLANPGLVFVNAQLGTYSAAVLDDWLPIQEAQRQVAEADPRSALIATVDEPRSDAIHFNVVGYKSIGVRFAEAAREVHHGEAIDAQARLMAARRVAAGNQLELEWDAAVSGGDATLFRVSDGLGAATVTAVVASGPVVTLSLDRPLSGAATVSYGWSVDPLAPWLRGPRGNAVACFHAYPVP